MIMFSVGPLLQVKDFTVCVMCLILPLCPHGKTNHKQKHRFII